MAIIGIGIDSVEIDRLKKWYYYPQTKLERIFTKHELAYCLENEIKSAERFAVRFAAKEAFFKAFSEFLKELSFLAVARHVSIEKSNSGKPILTINWSKLMPQITE